MTEITERRISWDELYLLAFECKACRAEMTLDLRNKDQRRRLFSDGALTMTCPFCGADFDSALVESIRRFEHWRQKVQDSGHVVTFRLPASETAIPPRQ